LLELFLRMKTKDRMLVFLQGLLTPKELEEFARRLEIVRLLKKGYTHRVISKKLKVGVATIERGAREISLGRFLEL
jgi:TrpR family trp operon transcriptional repressor